MEAEIAYFSDDLEGARASFKRALELDPEVNNDAAKIGGLACQLQFSSPNWHDRPHISPLLYFSYSLLFLLQNEEILENYGAFLAEIGPREEALELLQKAVELFPDQGFEKYMSVYII